MTRYRTKKYGRGDQVLEIWSFTNEVNTIFEWF